MCIGDSLRLIVNNQSIFTTKDTTLTKGKGFALNTSNYVSPLTRVTFDNIVARVPDASQFQTTGGSAVTTSNATAASVIPAAPAATARPSATSVPASTAEALKQSLQRLKIEVQSLAAIVDGTGYAGGTGGGSFDCGQFVTRYNSINTTYPTFTTSSEAANVQQANVKYADAIQRIKKDSFAMSDWCIQSAAGKFGTGPLTIPVSAWNPAREGVN
jgi:hypothetical protein